MNTAARPGRVTVDVGDSALKVVGTWRKEWDAAPTTSWLGELRKEFGGALGVAQKYHERLHAARIAKATGQKVELGDPFAREQRAKADLKSLEDLSKRVDRVEIAAFEQKMNLRPFDFKGPAHIRTELRNLLRSMTAEQRTAALEKSAFAEAALEGPAELSGLIEAQHTRLHDKLQRAKYPGEIDASDQAMEAAELVRRAIEAGVAAANNEIRASAAPVPTADPVTPAWA